MATIKSFTDIQQSKKLAKILPLESADMHYVNDKHAGCVPYLEMIKVYNPWLKGVGISPCWSLAALMAVIPYNVSFNKAVYRFKLVKFSDHWECYHENFGTVSTKIFKADNPIDACVEMILKLHELKRL